MHLASPTGPARVSRTYLHVVSSDRGVFQQPAGSRRGAVLVAARPELRAVRRHELDATRGALRPALLRYARSSGGT
jgi:hypothetical protein